MDTEGSGDRAGATRVGKLQKPPAAEGPGGGDAVLGPPPLLASASATGLIATCGCDPECVYSASKPA